MAGKLLVAGLCLTIAALSCFSGVHAADPELTSDFTPNAPAGTDGNFFKSELLQNVAIASQNFATVTPVNQGGFPALNGLGISSALIQFPAGTLNPPHIHPRGTELLYVLEGSLDVGIVDTANKLYIASVKAGDLFVFPKGLVHFQINRSKGLTRAVVSFSSANPGTVRLPNSLFKSGIADDVLSKGFGVSRAVIQQLKNAKVN